MRIIEVPQANRGRQGMTVEEATQYGDLLFDAQNGQGVVVDDSESDDYERTYARGERVRNAMHKHGVKDKDEVMVRSIQIDGEYVAVLINK